MSQRKIYTEESTCTPEDCGGRSWWTGWHIQADRLRTRPKGITLSLKITYFTLYVCLYVGCNLSDEDFHPFARGAGLFHNTTRRNLTLSSVLSCESQISPEPICRLRPFISIYITACLSPGQSWGRRAAYDPCPNQEDEAPHLPSPPTSCTPYTLAELLHYQLCSLPKWRCHSPGQKRDSYKLLNLTNLTISALILYWVNLCLWVTKNRDLF